MTAHLSVVVANATRDPAQVTPTVEALRRELAPGDQVVWVDRAGPRPVIDLGAARVETVCAPGDAGRGDLYGLGLQRVDGAVVAFMDSTTVPRRGWRRAVVDAFASAAVSVVGGPVLPPARLGRIARAGFLVEYGPHATPPFRNAAGDLSANNVAYRTEALRGIADGAVWKTVVNRRLRSSGVELVVVPEMRVEVTGRHDARWLVCDRVRAGRLYGSQAALDASLVGRMLRTMASVLLPFLLLARTVEVARRDPALRDGLLGASPVVLLATLAWSAGEAVGWATARPPHGGVM